MFNIEDKKDFYSNTIYFAVVFFAIFSITFGILYFLGLAPASFGGPQRVSDNEIDDSYWVGEYDLIDTTVSTYSTQSRPDHVKISKIGVDVNIEQPTSRDVVTLDQALTKGAVHYPGSGTVDQGNMFIFGHSTGLSVVRNDAYKAFNDLNKLANGDVIEIQAEGDTYLYEVKKVSLVDEDNALVSFGSSKRTLTISTCNTFGAKQERWVVEAEFKKKI